MLPIHDQVSTVRPKLLEAAKRGPFRDFYNQWFPLCLPSDVPASKPVHVKRLGIDFVLWRDRDGVLRAGDNYCPHRRTALSGGRVRDGQLECPFHGFLFDGRGVCTSAPCEGEGARLPRALNMEMFHVREQHDFIWLWFGDSRAELPEIPWFAITTARTFHTDTLTYDWPIDFDRMVENTLDLAHFPILHGKVMPLPGPRVELHEVKGEGLRIDLTFSWWNEKNKKQTEPTLMEFCYPSLAAMKVLPKTWYVVGTTPIDEHNVWFFSRVYQHLCLVPGLASALSRLILLYEKWFALPDDLRVMKSQPRRDRGMSEVFLPADVGITMWYQLRKKLGNQVAEGREGVENVERDESAERAERAERDESVARIASVASVL